MKNHKILNTLLFIFVLGFILSCCSSHETNKITGKNKKDISVISNEYSITAPLNDQIISIGNKFELVYKTKSVKPDSIQARYNNTNLTLELLDSNKYICSGLDKTAGKKNINIVFYFSDTIKEQHNISILALPEEKPKELSYRVIRKFKHDNTAYTQGLIYYNGLLYESTGRKQQSSIRKIDPKSGDILFKKAIGSDYFGEGITLIGNKLYMLTYKAQKGFVFDINTFEQTEQFDLQTLEGWGLTNDGNNLILSDGSAYIYFYDPAYYSLLKQLEICSNEGLISLINEMEFSPSGLYANIYGKDIIVKIDYNTGVVTHTLDLANLFPENTPRNLDYTLNGIAYNPDSKTYYVTGKQWPVMYEIEIIAD